MRNIYLHLRKVRFSRFNPAQKLLPLLLVCFLTAASYAQSIGTYTITPSVSSGVCAGTTLSVAFTADGGSSTFTTGTSFTVTISDATGSFTPGIASASIAGPSTPSTLFSGSISVTIPTTALTGSGYLIMVSSTSPVVSGTPVNFTIFGLPGAITGVNHVCQGSTIRLTSDTSGGIWSGSSAVASVNNSGTVTGLTTGTHAIVYTSRSTGCAVSTAITVNDTVNSGFISGTASVVCGSGGAVSFSDATGLSGGTWSVTNTSLATIDLGGSVNYNAGAGIDTVKYTVTSGSGCATSAIFPILVGSYVSQIVGGDSICLGASATYNADSTNSFVPGTWLSSDTTIASLTSATSGLVNGISSGTATLTYSAHFCGTTVSSTKQVFVHTVPYIAAISGFDSICQGATFTLTDSTSGGTWISEMERFSLTPGNILHANSVGPDTILYIIGNACGADTAKQPIMINSVPGMPGIITGNNSICDSNSLATLDTTTFYNDTIGGAWSVTNGNASIDPVSGFVTGFAAGTDTVIYTVTNLHGCQSAISRQFTVLSSPHVTFSRPTQSVCAGSTTHPVAFFSAVTVPAYTWKSDVNIGLSVTDSGSVSGSGPSADTLASFNTYSISATATFTVTPTVTNGCYSAVQPTFSITVNPIPVADTLTTANYSVCNGAPVTLPAFTASTLSTNFNWKNTSIDSNNIGMDSLSGVVPSGSSIPMFTAINGSSYPITVPFFVTPVTAGTVGCSGSGFSFNITVNPTPHLASVAPRSVCDNIGAFSFTPSFTTALPTTFVWHAYPGSSSTVAVDSTSTYSTGSITNVLHNTSALTDTVNFVVLSISDAGCADTTTGDTLKVLVYPTPVLTSQLTIAPVCNDGAINYTSSSATPGTTFTWSRLGFTITSTSGVRDSVAPNNGIGNISESIHNNADAIKNVVYFDTLKANGCVNYQQVNVVVFPTPALLPIDLSPVCDKDTFSYVAVAFPGDSVMNYSWWRDTTIGNISGIMHDMGTTNMIFDSLHNDTTYPINAGYIYRLTNTIGCTAGDTVFKRVNPTPRLSNNVTDTICSGTAYSYTAMSATFPTSYSWVRIPVDGINGDSTLAGSSDTVKQDVLNNGRGILQTVVYRYSLNANACANLDSQVVVVAPVPLMQFPTPDSICSQATLNTTNAITFDTLGYTPVTIAWTRQSDTFYTSASTATGYGDISNQTLSTYPSLIPEVVNYQYKVSFSPKLMNPSLSCQSTKTFSVTVNPTPKTPTISTPLNDSIYLCANSGYINFQNGQTYGQGQNVSYHWSASAGSGAQLMSQGKAPYYNSLFSFPSADNNIIIYDSSHVNGHSCYSFITKHINVSANAITDSVHVYLTGNTSQNYNLVCTNNIYDANIETNSDSYLTYTWGFDRVGTLDSGLLTKANGFNNDDYHNQNYSLGDSEAVSLDTSKYYLWVITSRVTKNNATGNDCTIKTYLNGFIPAAKPIVANEFASMKVYPNPANNYLTILFSNVNNASDEFSVDVYDIMGRKVTTAKVENGSITLPVNELPNGNYVIVGYQNGVKVSTTKFVKIY